MAHAPAPAHFLLPVRVKDTVHPVASISSVAHGSGAGPQTSFQLFLHLSRQQHLHNHNSSSLVSNSITQVEEGSEQAPRRNGRGGYRDGAGSQKDSWQQNRRAGTGRGRPLDGRRGSPATGRSPSWRNQSGASYRAGPQEKGPHFRQPNSRFQRKPEEVRLTSDQQGAAIEEDDEDINKDRWRRGMSSSSKKFRESSPLGRGVSSPSNKFRESSPLGRGRPQFFGSRNAHRAPWQQGPNGIKEETALSVEDREAQQQQNENEDVESKHFDGQGEKSAMARIVEKLRSIESASPSQEGNTGVGLQRRSFIRTPGSIFLPKAGQDLFAIGKNWSTPDHPIPEPGKGILDTRFPWEKDEGADSEEEEEKGKRVKPPTLAELTIPQPELKRLRHLALHVKQRLKIGRLGVTDHIVESILASWRTCEIVKVKCEGPPALNMRKTHEDLERKTRGLVIWRAGSAAVVYRGKDYGQPTSKEVSSGLDKKLEGSLYSDMVDDEPADGENDSSETSDLERVDETDLQKSEAKSTAAIKKPKSIEPIIDRDYEMEVDKILEDLGPRFQGWTGMKPLPVDGDLLPPVIPNYSPPFRLLPYGVKPNLNNTEMTNLRRLARPLPPHFVLGRNKGHQGLASAIVKLWEKSEIAKIAVKRGVQNTNNERMAEEVKRLTGGVLLSRDKEFITLYRGKDFLPPAVAAALAEREAMARTLQEEEERARAETSIPVHSDTEIKPSTAGTLAESLEAKATWQSWMDSDEQKKLRLEAAKARRIEISRSIQRKLDLALLKKEKAEKELEKVEQYLKPADAPADQETITEEERFMFRKLGLRMKARLLLGRRGVFDGVVENMHLHWKHRELVKILVKERDPKQLQETARMLEYESGGILVAVELTSKGQAIIVYRGKNYQRPAKLRPGNLLTKRKALKRSLEIQRRESLSKHILGLEKEIDKMKAGLSKMDEVELAEHADGLQEESDTALLKDLQNTSEEVDIADSVKEVEENSNAASFLEHLEGGGMFEAECRDIATSSSYLETTGRELLEVGTIQEAEASPNSERVKLKRLIQLGPIFRAEPLTNRERLTLRKQALQLGKIAHFNVGKSNVLEGLAKAIRVYFQKHALVKVGLRGRARGTSVQELIHELEEATGGVLVSQESSKVILYRGWPDGEEMPSSDVDYEELSPELRAAMELEDEDWVEDFDYSKYANEGLEASDDEGDDEDEGYDSVDVEGLLSERDEKDEGFDSDVEGLLSVEEETGEYAIDSGRDGHEEAHESCGLDKDGISFEGVHQYSEPEIMACNEPGFGVEQRQAENGISTGVCDFAIVVDALPMEKQLENIQVSS